MTGAPLNLILDVVILVLLGMTIVYAARLSLQLKRLRDSKADMDKIVRELVRNIDKAERAIVMLRDTAQENGVKLQRTIGNAVSLADELQLMTESGDRLASRLEALVDGVKPLTRDIQARTDALVSAADAQEAKPLTAQNTAQRPQARVPAPQNAAKGGQKGAQNTPQPATQAAPEPIEVKSYTDHLRKLDGDDVHVVHSNSAAGPSPMFAIRDPEIERGLDPLAQGVTDDPALYSEAERDLFRALKGR